LSPEETRGDLLPASSFRLQGTIYGIKEIRMSSPAQHTLSPLELHLFELYDSIPLGTHSVCKECSRSAQPLRLGRPVSLYHAGSQFGCDGRRILFAGKNARGDVGADHGRPFLDATAAADEWIGKWDSRAFRSWPFWAYMREIVQTCYPDLSFPEAWERVAVTNLVKCNEQENSASNSSADGTPYPVAEHCLAKLQVFRRELDALQPTHVVLFTGRAYDRFLGEAMFGPQWRDAPGSGPYAVAGCGGRALPWWEGCVMRDDGIPCRVLRTGHPQWKPKDPFVKLVSDWLMKE